MSRTYDVPLPNQEMSPPTPPEEHVLHRQERTIPKNENLGGPDDIRRALGVGLDGYLKAVISPAPNHNEQGSVLIFDITPTQNLPIDVISLSQGTAHGNNVQELFRTGFKPYLAIAQQTVEAMAAAKEHGALVHVKKGMVTTFGPGEDLHIGRQEGHFAAAAMDEFVSRDHMTVSIQDNLDLTLADHSSNATKVIVPSEAQ